MTNLIFAILITTSAGTFDVETTTDNIDDGYASVLAQPWYGDNALALELAGLLNISILDNGPAFLTDLSFDGTRYSYSGAFVDVDGNASLFGPRLLPTCPGGGVDCFVVDFATTKAAVPIYGMAILMTFMLWIMEAGRWSRRL